MHPSRLVNVLPFAMLLGCLGLFWSCQPDTGIHKAPPLAVESQTAEYVGNSSCAECHPDQMARWLGSHHDLAMQEAKEDTVLGDFGGATFTHAGVTTTFFRQDDLFMVRTDGPDGELQDFQVLYTFGVEPLQQYLVELPGGRLQALSICWDSSPKEHTSDSGRWFHLYPETAVDHRHIFHWTGLYQNWNHQCAECHSTNLRKGFDPTTGTYQTTWSEINVSCEACHGPASLHLLWAEKGAAGHKGKDVGLTVDLGDPGDHSWVMDLDTGIARRQIPRSSRAETEVCGRCHSRRGTIFEGEAHGRPLGDSHRLALLEDLLYHADGQIQDEVYVYGSFLQSKMYASGVTCRDCHDAHSLQLWSPGHGACARCHLPSRFDSESHHHHEPGKPGSSCLDCHMRSERYMVVDPRRDHSFRIPRPDLSAELGTPDACSDCHGDKGPLWAADQVRTWTGTQEDRPQHFGLAIHAAREGLPEADVSLAQLILDGDSPGIVRATAVSLLTGPLSQASLLALEQAASDPDDLVRRSVATAARLLEPRIRQETLYSLLLDSVRSVRIAAARALADVPVDQLPEARRGDLEAGLAEYEATLMLDADRPEARMNLGNLRLARGDLAGAEAEYWTALQLSPHAAAAAVNLADLYRLQKRDPEGETVLRRALETSPNDASLRHSLGLLLVRLRRVDEALLELEKAVSLEPSHTRYSVVLGVALHDTGLSSRALDVLRKAHEDRPGHLEALRTLALLQWDEGNLDTALGYAQKLLALTPHDPAAQQLVEELAKEASNGR